MNALDFSHPPFDVLTPAERQSIKKHAKVKFLSKDDRLTETDFGDFFVMLKGQLSQTQGEEWLADYSATPFRHDWLDLRHHWQDNDPHHACVFTAVEDSLLLQIDGSMIDRLSAQNRLVRQLLSPDLSERMQAIKAKNQSASISNAKHQQTYPNANNHIPSSNATNAAKHVATSTATDNPTHSGDDSNILLQPVTHIRLIDVHRIDETTPISQAAKQMTEAGIKHLLVNRQTAIERHPTKAVQTGYLANTGMITDTDICRCVAKGDDPTSTTVQAYSHFKLRTVHSDETINEALLKFIRYRIHRLPVVDDDGQIIGVLGQSDLLAHISHHSQLVTVQIQDAQSIDELAPAVEQIGQYIRIQHQNGHNIQVIARMVQTLNAQVFAKLWQLIVPQAVFENTCVIVMGSEGRGEQILRTDQDNALIVRNGFSHPELEAFADRFNQSLSALGYPLCDGQIMMNNALWRQPLNRFEKQVSDWFKLTDAKHGIWLSAVLDAEYVCGDERLLSSLKRHIALAKSQADPMFVRQFVRAALTFGEVNQWWQRFAPLVGKPAHADIDLKKAGIFPLVHGIRTLALENDLVDTPNTHLRLKALHKKGVLTQEQVENYGEALSYFMTLRLAVALSTDDRQARQVDPSTLSAFERDLLKRCLSVVKGFKHFLTSRYQLDYA